MNEKTVARIVAVLFVILFPTFGAVLSYTLQGVLFGSPFIYGVIFGLVFGGLQLFFPVTRAQAQEQQSRRRADRGKYGVPLSVTVLVTTLLAFTILVSATLLIGWLVR